MKSEIKTRNLLQKVVGIIDKVCKNIYAKVSVMTSKKRLFIATWIEGKNWGDDYLSKSLLQYIKTQKTDYKIIETNLYLDYHLLTEKDILLIGGGGLWGPSGTGCLEQKLFNTWMETKADLIIANIGIESFTDSSASKLVDLANKSKLISFRDEKSYRIAKQILKGKKCIWGADNTYLYPLKVKRSPKPHCIAVNVCGPEQENHYRKYSIKTIIKKILQLKPKFSIEGAVFSYHDSSRSDYKYCVQIDQTCKKTFSEIPFQDCELFIGMHFHSCLLALQNEIPTIGINYSDKVKRLFHEYDLDEFCIEPEDIDSLNKLPLIITSMYKNRECVVSKIRKGNARAKKRLAQFTVELKRILTTKNLITRSHRHEYN